MVNPKGLVALFLLLSGLVLAACGGTSTERVSSTSSTDQSAIPSGWSIRAPLIFANSETAVAEVGGLIYVIGGYPSTREISNAVQVYIPEEDRWRLTIPLPIPTHHAMAAAVNGKLYVIGGEANESGFAGGGFARGQLGGDGAFGGGFGGGGFGGGGLGGGFAGGTFGTVTTIENNAVTITTQTGDVSIQITSNTTFQILSGAGQPPQVGTLDDVEVGSFVAIQGPEDANGTVTAESITLLPQAPGAGGLGGGGFGGGAGGFGGGDGGFADGTVGVVEVIDGNTVTITTQSGPVVVELSEDTVFQSPTFGGGDSSPETREGLEIGRRIAVQGPEDANGNLVAETITLLPQALGGRFQGAGVGGGIQNDYIDTVWEFNPESAIWTLRTSMPTARSAGGQWSMGRSTSLEVGRLRGKTLPSMIRQPIVGRPSLLCQLRGTTSPRQPSAERST